MKKKLNIPKIVWVSGIFIILILILYLVIQYKVKYEDFNSNQIIIKSPRFNF